MRSLDALDYPFLITKEYNTYNLKILPDHNETLEND